MSIRFKAAAFAGLFSLSLLTSHLHAAEAILAQAGDERVTLGEFNAKLTAEQQARGRALSREEKGALLRALLNQRLLVAEARSQRLEERPEVADAIQEGRRQVLANALYERQVAAKAEPTQLEVEAAYRAQPLASQMATLSQILVASGPPGQDAADLAKATRLFKLVSKHPAVRFAAVARENSDDAASRLRGGDLGEIAVRGLNLSVAPLVGAAVKGQVLGPLKVPSGYAIVYVRAKRQQTLDEAREFVFGQLKQEKAAQLQQAYLDGLARKYKATLDETKIP